jgi:hypothetical protein
VNNKILLLAFVLALHITKLNAQENRVLILNDRGVGIKNFTVGNYIHFEFSNQQWITGYISRIKADTIDVKQFVLQSGLSGYGTQIIDTLKLGTLTLSINEIKAFAKDKGHFNSVFTNGAFLKTAGVGYVLLNITNSIIRKDPVFESRNLPHMAGGIIGFILGKIQSRTNPDYRPIGKRYSLTVL